jgi:hypothetical protein
MSLTSPARARNQGKAAQARELLTMRKESVTREANADPANTNDAKRRAADAASLEWDATYQQVLQDSLWLADLIALWDSRRSRLNRDFEVALIDYQHRQAMAMLDAQMRHDKERIAAELKMRRVAAPLLNHYSKGRNLMLRKQLTDS